MKPIGIGIDNFRDIILNNCFYVDKTKFIEEIITKKALVQLITRPRRFGKTLNMSMLKYFYDIENGEENRKLFDNLYISKSSVMEEQGRYPVIFISFKDVKANTSAEMFIQIKNLISDVYDKFSYVREKLNESELLNFDNIWFRKSEDNLRNSILNLSKYLKNYYNQEVILLIDEYDTPIISAYEYDYYDEIKGFFTGLYGSALKGNDYLKKAVLTGVMRVSKENLFSGLNNIKVNTVLEKNFSEYFGFTEQEVENSLKAYGLENRLKDVQLWYNGYSFGGTKVYNPFSITNFLDEKKIMPYWVNTLTNALINKVLKEANNSIFKDLVKLFQRQTIDKSIDIYSNLSDLKNTEQIWYLLTNAGYLTPVEEKSFDKFSIKIPNEEVHYFFERDFIKNFLGSVDSFDEILEYLINGELEDFSYELRNIMEVNVSCFDFDRKKDEGYYHVFILGLLLALRRKYFIRSNRESGRGRFDLFLEPQDKKDIGIIMEFKVSKNEKDLEEDSEKALKQIVDNNYDRELKERGVKDILLIGMAFHKREFKILNKRICC